MRDRVAPRVSVVARARTEERDAAPLGDGDRARRLGALVGQPRHRREREQVAHDHDPRRQRPAHAEIPRQARHAPSPPSRRAAARARDRARPARTPGRRACRSRSETRPAVTRWQPCAMSASIRSTFGVQHLGTGEDRGGAVAIELVDGEARALEEDERIVPVGAREHATRLVEIEARDQCLRAPRGARPARATTRARRSPERGTARQKRRARPTGSSGQTSSEQTLRVALDRVLERPAARLSEPAHHATAKLLRAPCGRSATTTCPSSALFALALAGRRRGRALVLALELLARHLEIPLRLPLPREPLVGVALASAPAAASRAALSASSIDSIDSLRKRTAVPPLLRELARALGELRLFVSARARARARARSAALLRHLPKALGDPLRFGARACDGSRRRASRRLRSDRRTRPPLSQQPLGLVERAERAAAALHRLLRAPLLERARRLLGELARGCALARPRIAAAGRRPAASRTASRIACACCFASSRIWLSSSSLVAPASACSTLPIAPAWSCDEPLEIVRRLVERLLDVVGRLFVLARRAAAAARLAARAPSAPAGPERRIGLAKPRREIARGELRVREVRTDAARARTRGKSASTISPRSRPSAPSLRSECDRRRRGRAFAASIRAAPRERASCGRVLHLVGPRREIVGDVGELLAPSRASRGSPSPRTTASTTRTQRSVALTTLRAPSRPGGPRSASIALRVINRAARSIVRVRAGTRIPAYVAASVPSTRRSSSSVRLLSSARNALRSGAAPGTAFPRRHASVSTSASRSSRSASRRFASGSPTSGGTIVIAGLAPHFGPFSGSLSFASTVTSTGAWLFLRNGS